MPTSNKPPRTPSARRSGFTVLELVIVITLMALITGAIAPATSKLMASKARRATLQQLEGLATGALAHFEDTGGFPNSAALLVTSTASGWTGPYVSSESTDTISGGSTTLVDAWSRPWRFTVAGDVLTIASAGQDGAFGGADDLAVLVDATAIRRAWTLERRALINTSINAYNGVHLATEPLPADWNTIRARLISYGFMPPAGDLAVDGFGNPWVPDPVGATPVLRINSTSF